MNSRRSDEEFIKKFWKILSTDSTMDNMRKDLHEDPKFKEWQEKFNKYLQEIIESDNSKSYEDIFTELGGLEMPNSTDYSDKLENLIKQVVDEKLRTLPEETKEEIFRKWDDRVKSFPII
ncbi:uncharacterized protein LOC110840856 isoform X4 [Zootermopsis nevadensis]|uniref:uncharacterized protein LOC110840856 isoform X4 n=1 Tax=Zootermopsis nevadensis TaxID=136037 RepID=UPI000B8ECA66|nr:uncharacterized protein LOC110840856 isoform X4 [Zootermopsis nevadensis]